MRIAPRFRSRAPEARTRFGRSWVLWAAVAVIGVAALAFGLSQVGGEPEREQTIARESATTMASIPATISAGRVEVPKVVGSTLAEARVVLDAAGFSISLAPGSKEASLSVVTAQVPIPGTVADASSIVTLTASAIKPPPKQGAARGKGWVVVVDPGHQAHSDSTPEPIGPGARETKPAVTGGTTGVETGIPEFELVLQISMNLKKRLERRGIKVVMTRTTNDVNISNSQRAATANKAGGDLFVRVHADGSPDRAKSGMSTLYPGSNRWTSRFSARSRSAAVAVQAATVKRTGAVDLGVVPRTDISGFNYATMPSILVECGFMSNAVEDRLLASPHYQDKLAEGITEGIVAYLSGQE